MANRTSVLTFLGGILAAGVAWSQGVALQEALSEMGVSLNLPDKIEELPVVQADPPYQIAFRFPGATYEVRISLFPQSWLVRESGGGNVDRYVPLFSMGLLAAMEQEGHYVGKTAELPGPTVKKEFGADTGLTTLAKGNKSSFGKGYEQIAVVFLYKAGRGVVVVFFLYNAPRDLEMDELPFHQAYYCFRFNKIGP